jgi:hypothetical protein
MVFEEVKKKTTINSEPREIMITVSICRCRRYRPLGRMSWLDAEFVTVSPYISIIAPI